MFEHVLLAVDFSMQSIMALKMAAALCEGTSRNLTVLSVGDPSQSLNLEGIYGTSAYALEEGERSLTESLMNKLEEICLPLKPMNIDYKPMIKIGSPSKLIVETANEIGADLIVIGAHSREGIFDKMIGSTTSAVVKKSTCPVLVASPPDLDVYSNN